MSIATQVITRTCGKCFRDLPETEFRFTDRRHVKRHSTCRECHNAYMAERRRAKRQGIAHQFASDVNRARQRVNRITALTERLCQRLGGVDRAAQLWSEAIRQAMADRKLHLVIRSMKAFARMQELCEQQITSEPEDLDEEDLRDRLEAELRALISKEPEVALNAAAQLDGWTVIPPTDIG